MGDFFLVVGQERVRQLFFFFKLFLSGWFVGRDAEDDQPGLLKLGVCIAEPASLNGSARSVGLRIEKKHHGVTPELFERNRVTLLVGERKIGSLLVCHSEPSIP